METANCDALLFGLAHDDDWIDVRLQLAVNVAIDRFPFVSAVVELRHNVHAACLPAIGKRAAVLDVPFVPLSGPEAFAEAAVGIEDPRADLLLVRIPADDLH